MVDRAGERFLDGDADGETRSVVIAAPIECLQQPTLRLVDLFAARAEDEPAIMGFVIGGAVGHAGAYEKLARA